MDALSRLYILVDWKANKPIGETFRERFEPKYELNGVETYRTFRFANNALLWYAPNDTPALENMA